MKKILLLVFMLQASFMLQAQMNGTFGNEWINYTQKYYKIKIAKDGIYTISYSDLTTAGLSAADIAAINPNNIQIFYRGIEVPIYVSAQGKSSFSSGDWIEFMGKKNDGKLDQMLYTKPEWQPQQYKSFFNDTAVYFLTWSAANSGKRLQYFSQTDYNNYTPQDYYIHREAVTFNSYYDGLNYTSPLKYHQSSDYTEGEGYISGFIWNKAVVNTAVNISDIYMSGAALNFKTEVFGVRDPVYISANNSYSHHVISKLIKRVGKVNTTLDSMDQYFLQYQHPKYEMNVAANKLDTGVNQVFAYFNIIDDLNITYDITYIQKLEFEYPRLYKLRNKTQSLFNIPGQGAQSAYISIGDYGDGTKNRAYIYDFENGLKVACTVSGSSLKAILPGTTGERAVYLADSTDRMGVGVMQPATFNQISTNGSANYLIVSHKEFERHTKKYAAYRDSTYKTQTVWIDDLYDQFCYGYNSPMAIRNYCNYMLQQNNVKPEYLLLIGKGIQTDAAKALSNINYVPTWGVPGSDIAITSGLNGSLYEASIPTGRIPVVNDSQLLVYLTKVRVYEKDINTMSLWKKRMLHTGGGLDRYQTDDLKYYLKENQRIAEADSMGASFSEYYKYESIPVTGSLTDALRDELKTGKSFTFYFGHGASDRMELDLGDPSSADNINKLPVMMSAGCLLGNSHFTSTPQMGEKWLFAHREKGTEITSVGAVAWIGNTWYGYLNELGDYSRNFYTNAFLKNYGSSLGNIMQHTVQDYQDTISVLKASHCKQVILLGDPSIKIYSPKYPDYFINQSSATGLPASVSLYPSTATAVSDSFALKITIYNQGKSVSDSFNVKVTRKFPDGKVKIYDQLTVAAPQYVNDAYFWIKSKDINTKGLNAFTVEVNSDRRINENGVYDNNKNKLPFNIYLADNNASLLFPYQYSTVSSKNITLTAQASTTPGKTNAYKFELDTSNKFTSPALITKIVSGLDLVNTTLTLPFGDSTAYYVRVKLNDSIYKVWDEHTFSYIEKSRSGWAQIDYPQYRKSTAEQIYLNDAERNYSFSSMSSNTYYFYSVGVNRSTFQNNTSARVFRKNNGENMAIVNGQVKNGWGFVAIDPTTETPWMPPSKYQYISPRDVLGNNISTPTPVYLFHNTAADHSVVDDMATFIDSIPAGYRVFVLKGESTGLNTYSTQDLNMFTKIGSNVAYMKKIKDEWPLCIKGFKGKSGSAYHVTADTIDKSIPPDKQIVIISDQLGVKFGDGSLTSERIGPAKKWDYLFIKSNGIDNPMDYASYDIIPIDKDGIELRTAALENLTTDSFDMTGIDANIYPFVKVKTYYADDSMRTPQNLNYWIINYKGVPEGSVMNNLNKKWLPKDTVSEGDSVYFTLPFQNISTFEFDSVMVTVLLTDFAGNQSVLHTEKLSKLLVDDTLFYTKAISTSGLLKSNKLSVTFNPNYDQAEQYLYNNDYNLSFYVKRDLENPLLDATFDGIRIFDGDLVSSTPKIIVSATDENRNSFITDTSQIDVRLKYPDGHEEKAAYSSAFVKFTPAEPSQRKAMMEFTPEKLKDGEYTLIAQANDAAGNKAGNVPYTVKFLVNNKPSITRFYPYPNPFTSKAHFVFTLTGEQVPQDIRIQIMTISGVVVREIFKEELGPLHIGNNTTDFAWDGTDQFGDKLGNGVYLYKVTARLNGQDMELATADTETYFKKGIGKIVILR